MVPIQLLVISVFLLMILSILVNQRIVYSKWLKFLDVPYYLAPVLASFLILLFGGLNINRVYVALTGSVPGGLAFLFQNNPLSIIILFLTICFIALTLDVSGFFNYVAVKTLKRIRGSGISLFVGIYCLASVLTLFTSNDILILTLTPFLLVFFRHLDVDPVPFLIAEFFAANIFSMGLLIGNPTNIIVATTFGLDFVRYFTVMILPALVTGLSTLLVLFFLFRDKVDVNITLSDGLPKVHLSTWSILGIMLLTGTIVSMAILPSRGVLLWHVSLIWALITLLVFVIPHFIFTLKSGGSLRDSYLFKMVKRVPWEIVPFIGGLFIIIEAFSVVGLTSMITSGIYPIIGNGLFESVLGVGTLTTLSCNLFNNIPTTVFFSHILSFLSSSGGVSSGSVYALIAGSNIGANLTPIGSLAGIMWMKMLRREGVNLTFKQFVFYGIKVTFVTMLVALLSIYVIFS